jgi:hypothetical protein
MLVDGLNRYRYVVNNPVNGIDPSGTKCKIRVHCFPARFCRGKVGYHCGLTIHTDDPITAYFGPESVQWTDYTLDGGYPGGPCASAGECCNLCSGWGNSTINASRLMAEREDQYFIGDYEEFPQSVCDCLRDYHGIFARAKIPYDPILCNSNWVLKCMIEHCKIQFSWNWIVKPDYYDRCSVCTRYSSGGGWCGQGMPFPVYERRDCP